MKTRSIVIAIALCVIAFAVCFAASPNMGTWKLNEAKSKLPAGPRNNTVIYEAAGDDVKASMLC